MAASKSSNRKSRFDNPDLFGGIPMKPIEPPTPTKEHTDEKKEEDMKNNIPEKKAVAKKNTHTSKTQKNQSEEVTVQNTKKTSNDFINTVETSEQEREVVKRGRGKSNNKLYTHSAYLTEKQTDFLYASALMTGNKVNKSDIIRKALDFYIECHPDEYERAMTFLEIVNNAKC